MCVVCQTHTGSQPASSHPLLSFNSIAQYYYKNTLSEYANVGYTKRAGVSLSDIDRLSWIEYKKD